jgi:hypothetical protein
VSLNSLIIVPIGTLLWFEMAIKNLTVVLALFGIIPVVKNVSVDIAASAKHGKIWGSKECLTAFVVMGSIPIA